MLIISYRLTTTCYCWSWLITNLAFEYIILNHRVLSCLLENGTLPYLSWVWACTVHHILTCWRKFLRDSLVYIAAFIPTENRALGATSGLWRCRMFSGVKELISWVILRFFFYFSNQNLIWSASAVIVIKIFGGLFALSLFFGWRDAGWILGGCLPPAPPQAPLVRINYFGCY